MASPDRAPAGSLDDALARGYRALGRRDHSVAEMRAWLERRCRLPLEDPRDRRRAWSLLVRNGFGAEVAADAVRAAGAADV